MAPRSWLCHHVILEGSRLSSAWKEKLVLPSDLGAEQSPCGAHCIPQSLCSPAALCTGWAQSGFYLSLPRLCLASDCGSRSGGHCCGPCTLCHYLHQCKTRVQQHHLGGALHAAQMCLQKTVHHIKGQRAWGCTRNSHHGTAEPDGVLKGKCNSKKEGM